MLAPPLAQLLRDAGGDLLAAADAIVPVPLHPLRRLERGFNQADDLARELDLPVWRALRRSRHGPPQAGLPAARRHANVREAFAISRRWWVTNGSRLRHRSVVLIDDVMTTGATLDACTEALLGAGVRSVHALTVARAVAAHPPPLPSPLRLASAARR